MNMNQSFIPGALQMLCTAKSGTYTTNLSNYIAGFTDADTPIDVAYAKAAFECNGDRETAPFPTFGVLGHMQTLMDRIMWNARKLDIAFQRAEQQEAESGGIYGLDLAQTAMDEVNVHDLTRDRIKDAVQSDYELLFTTQTLIMGELGIDGEAFDIDLLFFNPSSYDEQSDSWVKPTPASTYDEAMRVMQETVDELKANETKTKLAGFMANRAAALEARLAA